MLIELSDSYKICPPMVLDTASLPLVDAYINSIHIPDWGWKIIDGTARAKRNLQKANEVKSFINATRGTVLMRMLMVCKDGAEHHFDEMADALHIPQGNDSCIWSALRTRELIKFSNKHKYGKMYYKITELGKLVTSFIEANDVFFRVIRWFKTKDPDDIYKNMLIADVNNEDSAFDDVNDENCLKLVQSLLDTTSVLYKIGSVYKWMNTFMYLLKSSSAFYEHINIPEINAWLDSNADANAAMKSFYPKWKRIQKKWLKKCS